MASDTVDLWYAPLDDVSDSFHAQCAAVLSADEQDKAAAFQFERDRLLYRAAHGMVRSVLGRLMGIGPVDVPLTTDALGRPQLRGDTKLDFNLSHTLGMAVLAVGDGTRVGVDVERTDRRVSVGELSPAILSKAESEDVRSRPVEEQGKRFLAFWTLKEAYLKGVGLGFSQDVTEVQFAWSESGQPVLVSPLEERGRWSFALVDDLPGYWVALGVRHSSAAYRLRRFSGPSDG